MPSEPSPRRSSRRVRIDLDSDPMAVREGLIQMRQRLSRLGLGDHDLDSIEIVLAEILNNIGIHAYAGKADGRIAVTIMLDSGHLHCVVRDWGKPMPGGETPEGPPPEQTDLADAAEGGYGWFLIHSLTVRCRYARNIKQNRLSVTFRLVEQPDLELRVVASASG